MLFIFVTVTLCSLLQSSQASPKEDLIVKLPGLAKQPPFKQYSGYLKGDYNDDKYLHYWFVESSSNPARDPVVLWLNGGPGCSSDLGMLTEHGPFRLQSDNTVTYNPFAWNQAANMIYLESPVGVGYSYARYGLHWVNDSAVAIQNAIAVQDFFTKFPEYKDNDFFITGESYGGIYVPTLASQLLDIPSINLKGFAVGNGLSSDYDNENSIVYFAYYHGLIGDTQWQFLLDRCCPENGPNRCNFTKAAKNSRECLNQMNSISKLTWASGLDPYNLYAECQGGVNTGFSTVYRELERIFESSYFGWPFSYLEKAQMEMSKRKLIPKDKLRVVPACTSFQKVIAYMNNPEVKKALHISPHANPIWAPCSVDVSNNYRQIYSTMYPFYEKALSRKLRLLVYNGDVDMACNFLGDEWFVDSLPLKNAGTRKMWYYQAGDDTIQVAGFIKTFDHMSLVTVKGAGHMVPSDKPRPALEMFINFIQDKPFIV